MGEIDLSHPARADLRADFVAVKFCACRKGRAHRAFGSSLSAALTLRAGFYLTCQRLGQQISSDFNLYSLVNLWNDYAHHGDASIKQALMSAVCLLAGLHLERH
jgi:hypothetical protein